MQITIMVSGLMHKYTIVHQDSWRYMKIELSLKYRQLQAPWILVITH